MIYLSYVYIYIYAHVNACLCVRFSLSLPLSCSVFTCYVKIISRQDKYQALVKEAQERNALELRMIPLWDMLEFDLFKRRWYHKWWYPKNYG